MPDPPPTPPRRVIFRGRKVDVALQSLTHSDGTTVDREVILHPGAVALVPMVDDDHVCLIHVHRLAINAVSLEIPAGTLEPGESPDATAPRELREETGYTAERIRRVGEWWVSPSLFTERMYLYLCEGLTPGPTDHQPDEQITSVVLPWSEAIAMALDGRIEDAKSRLALLLCDRLRRS